MDFIALTPQQVVDRFQHGVKNYPNSLGTVMGSFLHRCHEHRDVRAAIESGGWLAGGFVRNVILGRDINSYFYERGDIDVFFPDPKIPNNYIKAQSQPQKQDWILSPAGNAMEKRIAVLNCEIGTNLQFVNHEKLCHPTLHETLERFDLLNSAVGWDGKHFHIPSNWQEVEESKLIFINRSNSPFLGSRISKYLNLRGLKGIHPNSIEKLKDWLVASTAKNYDSHLNDDKNLDTYVKVSIGSLFNQRVLGFLDKDDALLFIGKWNIAATNSQYNDYGMTTIEDWALHTIKNWET